MTAVITLMIMLQVLKLRQLTAVVTLTILLQMLRSRKLTMLQVRSGELTAVSRQLSLWLQLLKTRDELTAVITLMLFLQELKTRDELTPIITLALFYRN